MFAFIGFANNFSWVAHAFFKFSLMRSHGAILSKSYQYLIVIFTTFLSMFSLWTDGVDTSSMFHSTISTLLVNFNVPLFNVSTNLE